jgi:hypothetical protein
MENRPVEAELLHGDCRIDTQASKQTDRQTDVTKVTVAFHNFANAPKNVTVMISTVSTLSVAAGFPEIVLEL